MVKYSRTYKGDAQVAKAGALNVRVHFKNTHETAAAIKRMPLKKAQVYLKNVLAHTDCIPYYRFKYGIGRCAQAKKYKLSSGRWPTKSVKIILELLKNAESNAVQSGLDLDSLIVSHIQVNEAPKMRRRTYRAHGRINKYESSPSHIQLILASKGDHVKAGKTQGVAKNLTGKLEAGATAE